MWKATVIDGERGSPWSLFRDSRGVSYIRYIPSEKYCPSLSVDFTKKRDNIFDSYCTPLFQT